MSIYSPTVLPESYGTDWGQRLSQALLGMEERKRQDRLDKEGQLDRDIKRQSEGVRTGTAPIEGPTTVTVPDVPTFGAPDPATLGRVLSGGGPMIEHNGITGVAPSGSGHVFGDGSDMQGPGAFRAPSNNALAAALHDAPASEGPMAPRGQFAAPGAVHGPSTTFAGALADQGGDEEQMPLRNRAQTHAGAFDPATRTFGGSPLQMAIAAQHAGGGSGVASPGRTVTLPNTNPRYTQLDEGHYVDATATPDAQREREQRAQAEFQRELRGEDRQDVATAASGDRRRKMEAYIAAGIEPARAALYAENPSLAANDPRLGKATAPLPGTKEWIAAQEEAARIKARFRAPPAPDRGLVPVQQPDGSVVYMPRSQAAGLAVPAKSATGEGAVATAAKAKLGAAVAEMNNAHDSMADYEARLRAGTANISGWQQYINEVGNDFASGDHPAKQVAALAHLNKHNPDLARYVRNGMSFAEGESAVNGRASDFRTKMATFLSTAATHASPEMIDDIQRRRGRMMDALNRAMPAARTGGGAPSGAAAHPLQSKYEAAVSHLKAQGKSDAAIAAALGPPPGDE